MTKALGTEIPSRFLEIEKDAKRVESVLENHQKLTEEKLDD